MTRIPADEPLEIRYSTGAGLQGAELNVAYHAEELQNRPSALAGQLSMYWFLRAANQEDPRAINSIGELYLGHKDIPQDDTEARRGFERSARLGDATAAYNLGTMYIRGRAWPQDQIEAYKWFEISSQVAVGQLLDQDFREQFYLATRLNPLQVQMAKERVHAWLRAKDLSKFATHEPGGATSFSRRPAHAVVPDSK